MSVQETNLKAIADAIRAVDGSKALIPADQFKDRIALLANRMNVPLTVYVDAGASVKVEQSGTILTAISGEDGSCFCRRGEIGSSPQSGTGSPCFPKRSAYR